MLSTCTMTTSNKRSSASICRCPGACRHLGIFIAKAQILAIAKLSSCPVYLQRLQPFAGCFSARFEGLVCGSELSPSHAVVHDARADYASSGIFTNSITLLVDTHAWALGLRLHGLKKNGMTMKPRFLSQSPRKSNPRSLHEFHSFVPEGRVIETSRYV